MPLCASGKGPNQIARILREEKVLTPSNYYYQNHEKSHAKLDLTRPYAWSSSTVTGILDNKVYLGHTVGLRTTTISYKNKTTVHRPESECAVVENTHPALIKKEQWDIVQEVRTHKKRTPKHMDEPTPQIVLLFISRIEVGERAVKHSRHAARKIRIVYRDIGEWDHDEAAAETNRQQPQLTADAAHPVLLPA